MESADPSVTDSKEAKTTVNFYKTVEKLREIKASVKQTFVKLMCRRSECNKEG